MSRNRGIGGALVVAASALLAAHADAGGLTAAAVEDTRVKVDADLLTAADDERGDSPPAVPVQDLVRTTAAAYHRRTRHTLTETSKKNTEPRANPPSVFYYDDFPDKADKRPVWKRKDRERAKETSGLTKLWDALRKAVTITEWKSIQAADEHGNPHTVTWSLRVMPSSGALYPTEVYVYLYPKESAGSPGKDGGSTRSGSGRTFHVNVQDSHFVQVPGEKLGHGLALRHVEAPQSPESNSEVATQVDRVAIVLTSVWQRQTYKYGERGLRYAWLDAGHVLNSIELALQSVGLDASNSGNAATSLTFCSHEELAQEFLSIEDSTVSGSSGAKLVEDVVHVFDVNLNPKGTAAKAPPREVRCPLHGEAESKSKRAVMREGDVLRVPTLPPTPLGGFLRYDSSILNVTAAVRLHDAAALAAGRSPFALSPHSAISQPEPAQSLTDKNMWQFIAKERRTATSFQKYDRKQNINATHLAQIDRGAEHPGLASIDDDERDVETFEEEHGKSEHWLMSKTPEMNQYAFEFLLALLYTTGSPYPAAREQRTIFLFIHHVQNYKPGLYVLSSRPVTDKAELRRRKKSGEPPFKPYLDLVQRMSAEHSRIQAQNCGCGQEIAGFGYFAVAIMGHVPGADKDPAPGSVMIAGADRSLTKMTGTDEDDNDNRVVVATDEDDGERRVMEVTKTGELVEAPELEQGDDPMVYATAAKLDAATKSSKSEADAPYSYRNEHIEAGRLGHRLYVGAEYLRITQSDPDQGHPLGRLRASGMGCFIDAMFGGDKDGLRLNEHLGGRHRKEAPLYMLTVGNADKTNA